MTVETAFRATYAALGAEASLMGAHWATVWGRYTGRGRHYHNLRHLEEMLALLEAHDALAEDRVALELAIYYHDLIYNPLRRDNEAQSARAASRLLAEVAEETTIAKVAAMIEATAAHAPSADPDTALLLDIDMAILGAAPARYDAYAKQVRKEYWMYPGPVYRRGRRKALEGFLAGEQIYQLEAFRQNFETQARENVWRELGATPPTAPPAADHPP